MTRAALELGSKAWAGSVLTDTDTVFTLTADQTSGSPGSKRQLLDRRPRV